MKEHYIEADIRYQTFASDTPVLSEIRRLVEATMEYDEVYLVHPTFINSFTQEAALTNITHKPVTNEAGKTQLEYIAEPDIAGLLQFFSTQTRVVLCSRAILETRLALLGARLMKMQRARERATELVKSERRLIHQHISTMKNLRLLEAFAGFSLKE